MSAESDHVLQVIHDELQKQDPKLIAGLELAGDLLKVYNGQMLLRAEVHNDPGYHASIAHCHVVARIGNTSLSDPLDACVMGIHADRREGLALAARSWVANVGCVLFSLLHAKPVMNAAHFDGSDPWGVAGCHGFVGPLFGYGTQVPASIVNAKLFDCAAAMAPPGLIHLAKIVLQGEGERDWTRTLEIDGHLATYEEKGWKREIAAPPQTIVSQFAVFHYGDQSDAVESRRRLDDAIRQLVSAFGATQNVDDAAQKLQDGGHEPDVVNRVAAFVPLAFCRVIFGSMGITFSNEYVRITKAGTAETHKLMSEPAFARSIALCPELLSSGLRADGVKALAMTSSTFNAINQLLNSGSKPENLVMSPVIIPDADAAPFAIERALSQLRAGIEPSAPSTPPPPTAKKRWRFW